MKRKKLGIVLLNMGGPARVADVKPFLTNLFSDRDLMQSSSLFLTKILPKIIVSARSKRVEQNYQDIGGGSPIGKWTDIQGEKMARILTEYYIKNKNEYESVRHYVAFRYSRPRALEALKSMYADGVTHAVAFSQYPQYSCTTTGSSLTNLWEELKLNGMEGKFNWSLIDRWHNNRKFVEFTSNEIKNTLSKFKDPEKVVIIFSAHSLPISTVNRGDPYVQQVHETVNNVMEAIRQHSKGKIRNHHIVAWQSKVGPVEWQGPQTTKVIEALGRSSLGKSVLIVPIAFTSDHIETLHEIDIEMKETAEKSGIKEFKRTPSQNGKEEFAECLADVVAMHLEQKRNYGRFYPFKCSSCWQETVCRRVINPAY